MQNKTKLVFVVIPSLILAAPVKGAVALCNGLVNYLPVRLVALKDDVVAPGLEIDPRVPVISLAKKRSWFDKYGTYRRILQSFGERKDLVSISSCFSGDAFNFFFAPYATILSGVRGNLPRNYAIEFGLLGRSAALLHFWMLKRFDRVVAMSSEMARQLRKVGIKRIDTIGNFVDEEKLEGKREPRGKVGASFRFVFVGRLTQLKCPELPIMAAASLRRSGINCLLDFVGDGPMRGELESLAKKLDLDSSVIFHGHQANPYRLLQQCDCLVLPSRTEGISRAALEALFFGIPVILRDVDANREVVIPGWNGELFRTDEDLMNTMAGMATAPTQGITDRRNLLPEAFRQDFNVRRFLEIIYRDPNEI